MLATFQDRLEFLLCKHLLVGYSESPSFPLLLACPQTPFSHLCAWMCGKPLSINRTRASNSWFVFIMIISEESTSIEINNFFVCSCILCRCWREMRRWFVVKKWWFAHGVHVTGNVVTNDSPLKTFKEIRLIFSTVKCLHQVVIRCSMVKVDRVVNLSPSLNIYAQRREKSSKNGRWSMESFGSMLLRSIHYTITPSPHSSSPSH